MRKGHPLTDDFRARIQSYSATNKYQLARRAGISPSTLTAWGVGGYSPVLDDARALKLAALLDVPASNVFAKEPEGTATDSDSTGRERRDAPAS